jgi:metallophosphoesterase superfamily enzyme
MIPQAACDRYELAPGVFALPESLLFLKKSRALVVADAHLGYEDVIGGALPLWSTHEATDTLLAAARKYAAAEIIFLGDVIHGSRMSAGAARVVGEVLARLREQCTVTLVVGNHEGASRGEAILGDVEDAVERDGWVLVHGDEPVLVQRAILGHIHPSLPLGGGTSVPAFLATRRTIVVPAFTPYSPGLSVLSKDCADAVRAFGDDLEPEVVGSNEDRVFPFGSREALRKALYDQPLPMRRFRSR